MQPHSNPGVERRFMLSIALTIAILVIEVAGGFWTASLALLSDAAHVFMDVFALALSYLALRLSARPADNRHTYGWHRLEVMAALVNGLSLLFIAFGIWRESFERWQNPQPIRGPEMLVIAVLGLVVNLLVAFVLGGHAHEHDPEEKHHEYKKDLNLQSAFLHVVGDAISSVGVIIAAVIISLTHWQWVDPLVSILIGAIIALGSYRVLRGSLHILVEGTPQGLSRDVVAQSITSIPEVSSVHDLHIWNICSGHIALSAHVVINPDGWEGSSLVMKDINNVLSDQYGINHTTIQFENTPCTMAAECQ
jgi:cobalt-zinc-cadmium efflux system protein